LLTKREDVNSSPYIYLNQDGDTLLGVEGVGNLGEKIIKCGNNQLKIFPGHEVATIDDKILSEAIIAQVKRGIIVSNSSGDALGGGSLVTLKIGDVHSIVLLLIDGEQSNVVK